MIITTIPYCPKNKQYTHKIHNTETLYGKGKKEEQAISGEGLEKDLAFIYNETMQRVNDDDWVCFVDHDAIFTTPIWYKQMESIIENINPNVGALTCITNRLSKSGKYQWASLYYEKIITKLMQDYNYKVSNSWVNDFQSIHDMRFHRDLGLLIKDENETAVIDYPIKYWRTENQGGKKKYASISASMSGVIILVSKKAWNKVHFPLGSKCSSGLLGVDNWFHKELSKHNFQVKIMTGIYVYHWYQCDENLKKFNSLIDNPFHK